MKYPIDERLEDRRVDGPSGYPTGAFIVKRGSAMLRVIVSDGGGWDHVSVSLATRTPTWDELEYVRRLVFRDDETVMQLHVPRVDHVNTHEFCLHLWRPQSDHEIERIRQQWKEAGEDWPYEELKSPGTIPRPPKLFV